jgi:hypothetical protein
MYPDMKQVFATPQDKLGVDRSGNVRPTRFISLREMSEAGAEMLCSCTSTVQKNGLALHQTMIIP